MASRVGGVCLWILLLLGFLSPQPLCQRPPSGLLPSNYVLEPCSIRGVSKVNIFMQMFRIRPRLRKLLRVLSVGEKEGGHFLPKTMKRTHEYCSILNG
uniref:Secreted protein n=1 Tax=Amphilophus citrinellus TaxID=61819 RepID=A0A3Q0R416_AMPCI